MLKKYFALFILESIFILSMAACALEYVKKDDAADIAVHDIAGRGDKAYILPEVREWEPEPEDYTQKQTVVPGTTSELDAGLWISKVPKENRVRLKNE